MSGNPSLEYIFDKEKGYCCLRNILFPEMFVESTFSLPLPETIMGLDAYTALKNVMICDYRVKYGGSE